MPTRGRDERGLHHKEQYPARKDGAVDMDDRSRQMRAENAGEVVRGSESDKYNYED